MRTAQDVANQKASRTASTLKTASYSLPPGYIEGFQQVISSNQVVLKKGIADIRGKIIRAGGRLDPSTGKESTTHYVLNWEDFIIPNATTLRGMTYYIYMEAGGKHLIDVLTPYYDSNSFGWYHRTLYPYRYIQSFYVDLSGNYLASEILMGYNGTGSNDAPHEGDWRVIMFQGAQKTQEYTAGTWVDRMHFGYLVLGLLLTMVGCSGIFHPLNPPPITEFLPQGDFKVFNFENNYEDQNGLDIWTAKTHLAFTVVNPKFGAYCLRDDNSNNSSYLDGDANCTKGESQTAIGWFKFWLAEGVNDVISIDWGGYWFNIDISANRLVTLTVLQNSIITLTLTGNVVELNEWVQLGFTYNKTTNTVYFIQNNQIKAGQPVGNWGGVSTSTLFMSPAQYMVSAYTSRFMIDAVLFYPDTYLDPNILIQHYNHRVNWTTDGRTLMDMTISAGPGGNIHLMDDVVIDTQLTVPKIVGNQEVTGNLDVDGTLNVDGIATIGVGGSPFYDPKGVGTLGTPKPTALTTGNLNPANTNVTICTAFSALPANCYLLCTVRFLASTVGRVLSIWQDSAGTVPGIDTFAGLAMIEVAGSSQIQHKWIKLDASGNFYWQVDNADVSLLNFTGIMYLI